MKRGGVAVGVIVLLGAGGHQYGEAHVRDTVRVLNAMGLDRDDIVYFSELVTDEGLPYAQHASQAELRPLSADGRLMQADAIERQLKFSRTGGIPPISKYDIHEFVY